MKTNQDLKLAKLPHCDWREFLKYSGQEPMPQKDIDAMDHYFSHFVPPGKCIKCGCQQGGTDLQGALGIARFKWGIRNGEGNCSTGGCGWPARAIHRNVGPIQILEMILQYHPDVVTFQEHSNGKITES